MNKGLKYGLIFDSMLKMLVSYLECFVALCRSAMLGSGNVFESLEIRTGDDTSTLYVV